MKTSAYGSLSLLLVVMVLPAAGEHSTPRRNSWQQLFVPPVVPCSLPRCDLDCEERDMKGLICPRAATTIIALRGHVPAKDACLQKEDGWNPMRRPSAHDSDGCGPCLLGDEHSACHDSSNPYRHRAARAGGPPARHAHSSVMYETPRNSEYAGATIMIVFGGIDRAGNYLNDVWVMCLANCPSVKFVYTDGSKKDVFGLPLLINVCPEDRCRWQEKMMSQSWEEWSLFVDHDRARDLKGVVPMRPSGRAGHSAVLGVVRTAGGGGRPVMTIFGGQSPNCSDFCNDVWQYSILDNRWYMVYGEWVDRELAHTKLYNYSAYNQESPTRRHAHAAVSMGSDMFVWGGHGNGSLRACCGQALPCRTSPGDDWYKLADSDCPFLNDLWVTSLAGYEPFFSQLAKGMHTQQSSTIGLGTSHQAVDGRRAGRALDGTATQTDTDSQAWWQVDLGAVHKVSNVTIFNALDDQNQRLQNFYVLASSQPFVSDRLQQVLLDPFVWKAHVMYPEEHPVSAVIVNQEAQYVRIQLASTDFLSLAEVEVWGHPKIEDWQNLYGEKRWTKLYPHKGGKVPATPRAYASMLSLTPLTSLLLYAGRTRESPYWLSDMYLIRLSDYSEMARDGVKWSRLEPERRQPQNRAPLGREKHAAVFSEVCSQGYYIERQDQAERDAIARALYPGLISATPWCQGQVLIYGGQTEAATDASQASHPNGFLGDIWILNISSNVISEVHYDTSIPSPPRRSAHTMIIHHDQVFIYGGSGTPDECREGVCGDVWALNVSGPGSCPEPCSAHGVCEFGFCQCSEGWLGPECAHKACPNSVCFHDYVNHALDCVFCAGHGTCGGNGTCTCEAGWKGEDCSILHCPGGCSGHGTCKLGGICECDSGFGGEDCFLAFCPNNCTEWGDGIDRGVRGDCEITRYPPCCGTEPSCTNKPGESPSPCTQRATGFGVTPSHQVEAICYCADAYMGSDCSKEVPDVVIDEGKRRRTK